MARNRRAPKPEGLVVTCPTCKSLHSDITENHWQQRKYACRDCRRANAKSIYSLKSEQILETRKSSDAQRRSTLKHRYGLTIEQWETMVADQNGACLICSLRPESENFLHVDHNHLTGEVRGLLCNNCNVGLGYFADNPERLMKAAMYLQLSTTFIEHSRKETTLNG